MYPANSLIETMRSGGSMGRKEV
uniref:Uncharacterized protein n=1 Tax=Anguilla anguilla TaxID=7936 RepID=A0A0E9Q4T5_ANGAN